jgi:hypothetical protein
MKNILRVICLGLVFLCVQPLAKTVEVEIKGRVDLDEFECQTPTSPIIKMVCYKEDNKYLLVKIKDTWTQYCEVDPTTYKNFQTSGNMSKFFNEKIKAPFSCYH